jgi:protocatechuate 4,5-dioxygenase alpha chain
MDENPPPAHAQDTYVFDIAHARRGVAINRLCGSLKHEENRRRFLADEESYCQEFGLSPEQKGAILDRDWTAMLDLGGSIFYTFKLAQVDKVSMQHLGGVFSGMSEEEFTRRLRSGGRSFG